jgi:hypothetical protein
MTWITDTMDEQTRRTLDQNQWLRWSDRLIRKAPFGPTATQLSMDPEIRKYLLPGVRLAEGSDVDAYAFGSQRTFWVLDPQDPDAGIWGLNAVARADLVAQAAAGAPMASGYFMRIGKVPPPEVMKRKMDELSFMPGFAAQYWQIYPDPDKVAADAAKAAAAKKAEEETPKPYVRPTLELTVVDNTIIANKTAEESRRDEAHPGVPLAGPGVWQKYVGNQSPKEFGLPRPIVAFQEDTGEVTPAVEEFESIKEAAQKGDAGAQQALTYLGLSWA